MSQIEYRKRFEGIGRVAGRARRRAAQGASMPPIVVKKNESGQVVHVSKVKKVQRPVEGRSLAEQLGIKLRKPLHEYKETIVVSNAAKSAKEIQAAAQLKRAQEKESATKLAKLHGTAIEIASPSADVFGGRADAVQKQGKLAPQVPKQGVMLPTKKANTAFDGIL